MTRVSAALLGANSDLAVLVFSRLTATTGIPRPELTACLPATVSLLSALPTLGFQYLHCWVDELRSRTSYSLGCVLSVFLAVVSCRKLYLVSECSCGFTHHDENPVPAYKTTTQNFT